MTRPVWQHHTKFGVQPTKSSLYTPWWHMGGREVQLYSFLTSTLGEGKWSASRSGRFTTRERASCTHWIGGWVGFRSGLHLAQNMFQPVSQRNTHVVLCEFTASHSSFVRFSLWRTYQGWRTSQVCTFDGNGQDVLFVFTARYDLTI